MQKFSEHFDISHPNPSTDNQVHPPGWSPPAETMEHHRSISLGSQSVGSRPSEGGSPQTESPKDMYEYYRSLSPTLAGESIMSPGLESVKDDSDKEVAYYPPATPHVEPMHSIPEDGPTRPPPRKRRRWLWIILALLLCVAIGLGVGLGVGLTRNSKSSVSASNSSTPDYYSTYGAFNGTGLALASESFGANDYGDINLYFQHHSGQIRVSRLSTDGSWQGGTIAEVVAGDAKNASPIAAVAYAMDDISAWHIFYIDTNNTVRERINTNTTNIWVDGPLNDLNLQAMDDRNVGLEACWQGSFYGTANYTHSPVFGQVNTNNTSADTDQTIGIHLWYGLNDTVFNEVGWTYGDTTWTQQQTFQGFNAHAGVGCYSWATGSISYVFFVNLEDELEIWWKDLNTSTSSNTTHPVNTWTETGVTIPGIFTNSSLGYTNFLYAQMSDLHVEGFNISFAAENTTLLSSDTFTIGGDPGLAGTHMTVTTLPNDSGGNSLLAFYQTSGDDITEFVRDLDQGQWTWSDIPISDS